MRNTDQAARRGPRRRSPERDGDPAAPAIRDTVVTTRPARLLAPLLAGAVALGGACAGEEADPPGQRLTGQITASRSTARALGVRVVTERDGRQQTVASAPLAADGSFSLQVPPGRDYRVEVLAQGAIYRLSELRGTRSRELAFDVCTASPVAAQLGRAELRRSLHWLEALHRAGSTTAPGADVAIPDHGSAPGSGPAHPVPCDRFQEFCDPCVLYPELCDPCAQYPGLCDCDGPVTSPSEPPTAGSGSRAGAGGSSSAGLPGSADEDASGSGPPVPSDPGCHPCWEHPEMCDPCHLQPWLCDCDGGGAAPIPGGPVEGPPSSGPVEGPRGDAPASGMPTQGAPVEGPRGDAPASGMPTQGAPVGEPWPPQDSDTVRCDPCLVHPEMCDPCLVHPELCTDPCTRHPEMCSCGDSGGDDPGSDAGCPPTEPSCWPERPACGGDGRPCDIELVVRTPVRDIGCEGDR
jgi:hypothetical protein